MSAVEPMEVAMLRSFVAPLVVVLLSACGPVDEVEKHADALPDIVTSDRTGALETVLFPDIPGPRDSSSELRRADTAPDFLLPACQPGDGCFLDKCVENADCQSGWCVEHRGEAVCSMNCTEECPAGWTCKQLGASDPDVLFICVSNHANLCKPCNGLEGCQSVGGADDVCVAYGAEGAFCGGLCATSDDCPWGFTCQDAVTIDGLATTSCVAEAGVCPCTDAAVALALWTGCKADNDYGSCEGKRVCTEQGLSDCDAVSPVAEECNGVDDDCDGEVDEPDLVEGEYVNLCDDGNECTDDSCLGEPGCSYQNLDGEECKDGDPCTVADLCIGDVCAGSPVECQDDNPCTDDSCDETGGCYFHTNTHPCDDGNPCTLGDQCNAGECLGVPVACDCLSDENCLSLEDEDLCNGTLVCNTDSVPFQCEVDLTTLVDCPEASAFCQQASCDPASGECSVVPANEGLLCDDGDACTTAAHCVEGECTEGVLINCNDGNPCTDDTCEPQTGCSHVANANLCNDGDVCTTADQCVAGECVGGPPLVCTDENACNGLETCDPDTGCMAGQSLQCDDGDFCNGVEGCDPATGCTSGEGLVCDDGNPCTSDTCDPAVACLHAPAAGPCNDGDLCTSGDQCAEGKCAPGPATQCDDGNLCTTDTCEAALGCVFYTNDVPCDDSDLCTTGDHCHLGGCVAGGALTCDDGNLCTDDSCEAGGGCVFNPNQLGCDDGTACTENDHCAGGWCVAGEPLGCDDANLCSDDWCDPQSGCRNDANADPCDDGDLCTLDDVCVDGACAGGPAPDCDDGILCTDDSCDPAAGCLNENNAAPCSDDSLCTVDDACAGGACAAGPPLDCDFGELCMEYGCEADVGCTSLQLSDCCGNGVVEPGEECDDGNAEDGDGCTAGCAAEEPTVKLNGYTWYLADKGANCKTTCEGMDMSCIDLVQVNYVEANCSSDNAVCPNFFPGLPCVTDGDGPRVVYSGVTPVQCKYRNWNYGGMTCTYSAGGNTAHMCACKDPGTECGNGILEPPEKCDDGNQSNNDGCTAWCIEAECGDGHLHEGEEECDDGNEQNQDACTNECKENVCGDGVLNTGVEECDDGNNQDGDACSADCKIPSVQTVELNGYTWYLADKGANCKTTCEGMDMSCIDLVQLNYIEANCSPDNAVCPNFFPGLPCVTDGDGPRVVYSGVTPVQCKYRNWNYGGMTCTYSAGGNTAHMCACN